MKENLKKNHSFQKSAALVSSLLAICIMSAPGKVPVFAEGEKPLEQPHGEQKDIPDLKGTITAHGIGEEGASVTAWQILDGIYSDNEKFPQFLDYVLMDPEHAPIENMEKPTAEEISAIANAIEEGKFTADQGTAMERQADGTYTASVEPGMYLLLVKAESGTVYNPGIVSVNVKDAYLESETKLESGGVNFDASADFFEAGSKTASSAWMKSSESTMTKSIADSSENESGDTVSFGDAVTFRIDDLTIPSFSEDYKDPHVFITDTLDPEAFETIRDLVVKVNGKELAPKSTDGTVNYTLTSADGKTEIPDAKATGQKNFRIAFSKAFLTSHRSDAKRPAVEITYRSSLLPEAGVNFAENLNHAELHYSNDPTDETKEHVEKRNTYHYTFGIDTDLDSQAEAAPGRVETHEVNKVKATGREYETVTKGITTRTAASTDRSPQALAGAEFTLYSDEACKTPVLRNNVPYKAVSDANGHFSWTGLDEGTYYIQETKAPDHYSLSDIIYRIVIEADLDSQGILQKYTVTTSRKTVEKDQIQWMDAGSASYEAEHSSNEDGRVTNTTITQKVSPMEVVNSRVRTLPSTGDRGIGSFILMAVILSGCLAVFTIAMHIKKNNA